MHHVLSRFSLNRCCAFPRYNIQVRISPKKSSTYQNNDLPMVDKAVDATWPNFAQADKYALSKGIYILLHYYVQISIPNA